MRPTKLQSISLRDPCWLSAAWRPSDKASGDVKHDKGVITTFRHKKTNKRTTILWLNSKIIGMQSFKNENFGNDYQALTLDYAKNSSGIS